MSEREEQEKQREKEADEYAYKKYGELGIRDIPLGEKKYIPELECTVRNGGLRYFFVHDDGTKWYQLHDLFVQGMIENYYYDYLKQFK